MRTLLYVVVTMVMSFWVCTPLSAQALKGIVLVTNAKGIIEPVQGALVHWAGTSIGTSTDSSGVFVIPTQTNSRILVVQSLGFKTDSIQVNSKNFVKVMLINKSNLNEVTINYERKTTEVSFLDPWKTTIMNEKELFKSACCNLSESFETNPSVDVSYADALTGTKQIQLLGLATQYTQLTQEAIPATNGLAALYGFTYTPGTWVNSIQLSKGIGSVTNGFESIAGQINVELHKSDVAEKAYVNIYASEGGRLEFNSILNQKVNDKFSHSVFAHYSSYSLRMDRNGDGYLDNPLGAQFNGMYRFKWANQKGLLLMGGIRGLSDEKMGGQKEFTKNDYDTANPTLYGTQVNAKRGEGWLKVGYVFPKKIYKSIGLQMKATNQTYDNYFGKNSYLGKQQSGYANLIFQSIIGNTNHKYRAGFSSQWDKYDERFMNIIYPYHFYRTESVNGLFAEYTYTYLAKFTLVAGFRLDNHNLFGYQATPRLHLRYAVTENTVVRAAIGKGWRTPNLLAENSGSMVSSRIWNFNANQMLTTNQTVNHWQIKPEVAWNYGLNITHEFKLNYRPGTLSVDYYYTQFTSQKVVDKISNPQSVLFYQLNGKSFSNSIQCQLDYQPIRRLDVRLAYRWYDIRQQQLQGLIQIPMIAQNRAFLNVGYKTKNKWSFDATVQWTGPKIIPPTITNPADKQLPSQSPDFFIVNTQVTKSFKNKLDVYLGIENVFNFKQNQPIIDGGNPFGTYFDASLTWGPVFGRMVYGGIRYRF